jgi:hypothetical protein
MRALGYPSTLNLLFPQNTNMSFGTLFDILVEDKYCLLLRVVLCRSQEGHIVLMNNV